jgi:hypothetical protein
MHNLFARSLGLQSGEIGLSKYELRDTRYEIRCTQYELPKTLLPDERLRSSIGS